MYNYTCTCMLVILHSLSQVAKTMGPGHTVVTCLCDSGQVGLYLLNLIYNISLFECIYFIFHFRGTLLGSSISNGCSQEVYWMLFLKNTDIQCTEFFMLRVYMYFENFSYYCQHELPCVRMRIERRDRAPQCGCVCSRYVCQRCTMASVDVSIRDRWLYYLQQQLAEDEGVEHLKLALQADINPNTAELIKTPADLFHAIAKGDEELALAKFHCALDSLGRQLRGHMCIRNADALYGLKLPPPLPRREQTTDFQFFLCLTKISKTLRNHQPNQCNGQKEVIRWFSSKRLLNTYHSNLHSLPDLFVRAYRARIITPGDTHELHDCLSHHKLEKALKYLHEYYGAVFPPLPGVDNKSTNGM